MEGEEERGADPAAAGDYEEEVPREEVEDEAAESGEG